MPQKKKSAGILLIRFRNNRAEFFLGHLGGPYWQHKDDNAWCFPKGELEANEDELTAAKREWIEETNSPPPPGDYVDLGVFSNKSKEVRCFAVLGDTPAGPLAGSPFILEWPPKSGTMQTFYELDRSEWFDADTAKQKIHSYLRDCIDVALQQFTP